MDHSVNSWACFFFLLWNFLGINEDVYIIFNIFVTLQQLGSLYKSSLRPFQNYLEDCGWEVLPHFASSDYHFSRMPLLEHTSLQLKVSKIRLIPSFLTSKVFFGKKYINSLKDGEISALPMDNTSNTAHEPRTCFFMFHMTPAIGLSNIYMYIYVFRRFQCENKIKSRTHTGIM